MEMHNDKTKGDHGNADAIGGKKSSSRPEECQILKNANKVTLG